jgi:hypothetical protein
MMTFSASLHATMPLTAVFRRQRTIIATGQ